MVHCFRYFLFRRISKLRVNCLIVYNIYIYLSLCIIPPDLLRISVPHEVSHEKPPEKTSPADATAEPAKAQAAEPSEADGKDGNENQNADGGDKNKSTEAT